MIIKIKFRTELDLKFDDNNVDMLKTEIEKINQGLLEIKFIHSDGVKKMDFSPILSFEILDYSSNIVVNLELHFEYFNKKNNENEKYIENAENILIYLNSMNKKDKENKIVAILEPSSCKIENEYHTTLERCRIEHGFKGQSKVQIIEFIENIMEFRRDEEFIRCKRYLR